MILPRLSVSIVVYNSYEQVKTIVQDIEAYTSHELTKKVFIIDNSEKTKSQAEFQEYINTYNDVIYIFNNRNIGFGGGHNVVIPQLESDYHAIVNPDIEINDDVFSSILMYMEKNKHVGMVIPKILDSNGDIQMAYRKEPTVFDMCIRMMCKSHFKRRQAEHTLQQMDYDKPFQVPFAQGCFLVVRTALLKEIKGFDERYFMYMEDADLSKRINEKSCVMYYPGASAVHKWEKGSHKSLKLMRIHVQSMIRYFNKWGWKIF